MKKQLNPFIISGYEGSDYFCDRVVETEQLLSQIENGNNVALIATRRMGKSGLIKHCFQKDDIKNEYYTFFIDIYDTKNLSDFVAKLSKNILDSLKPYGRKAIETFWNCVHSLQTGISFSPSGDVSFNVQLGDIHYGQNTLDEIFEYLSIADRTCIVAIDEFQQIATYPEGNVEATLRTYVQNCRNARFIFAGSQRHTMGQMFTSAARPFFQSVSIMHLDAINMTEYNTFAKNHFLNSGKLLNDDVTDTVYNFSKGITWYTQKLFNTMYASTLKGETCNKESFSDALDYILATSEYSFKETIFRLPEKQKNVLVALAKSGPVKQITSGAFIRQHHLPSASSVQAAVKGLLEKDFVTCELGEYKVYDLFLAEWIIRQ